MRDAQFSLLATLMPNPMVAEAAALRKLRVNKTAALQKKRSFQAVVAEHCIQGAARVAKAGGDAATELEL
jgi:hypothetical protein